MPSPFVCVHPGASVPARTASPAQWAEIVGALVDAGRYVLLTGTRDETAPVADAVAPTDAVAVLDHHVGLEGLAWVLSQAQAAVVGNTGPAHLAAAVGTPVVSLFPPTLPSVRWRPWGVSSVVLGDQDISCRGCRARRCPIAIDGRQPCLSSVRPEAVVDVVDAVRRPAPELAVAARS
jgi:ADP-heptose:LPS heptosyltransferase